MGGSGGGSSGGGGGSGKVDYPDYMKAVHEDWLRQSADVIDSSIVDIMNAALGNSPWSGESPYNPATPLSDAWTAVCAYNTLVDSLSSSSDWVSAIGNVRNEIDDNLVDEYFVSDSLLDSSGDVIDVTPEDYVGLRVADSKTDIDAVIDDTYIDDDVMGYADNLRDHVDNQEIPNFEAGMRDINAVQSSAFIVGRSVIYSFMNRDIAKYSTQLREGLHKQRNEMVMNETGMFVDLKKDVNKMVVNETELKMRMRMHRNDMIVNSASEVIRALLARVEFERTVAALSIEAKRIHIVASKEESDEQLAIDENDAQWDLEVFQHGANLLAAIGGGTATPSSGQKKPGAVASALAGGLSGAAAGAMIGAQMGAAGGPWGAAIGAAVGIGAALLT